jgi:glycosyltransferase involved in cell wall biosynthesis
MRLAIVTHNVIRGDGQGRVAYEIACYALRQGAEVTLLCDRAEPDLLEAGAQWIPIHPRQERVNLIKAWKFSRLADRKLDQRQGQFDVIMGFGFTLTRPHQVNVAQFVHAAWGQSPAHTARQERNLYGLYQWAYTTYNSQSEQKAFRQAQVQVACSTRVKQELIQTGIPENRIRVILNAADPQEFHPGHSERTAIGLPSNVPLALFAGDIRTPRKNLDTVLRALTHVPSLHLAVVGTLDNSPYPKLAGELGVGNRVHFLGYRRDVPQIMRAVDVFAFPSRYEPFGIVMLEAMNSGVPVITARTVGAAEIVTPECGVVIEDPDDVPAFAAALQSVIEDAPRLASMGQAARKVAEQHTWSRMAHQYWELFQEVAA